MYGARYFGPRFFGPRYWGSSAPPLPDDLLGAIKTRFEATLAGTITGGIYLDEAPRKLPAGAPYVVVAERRARLELFTSDSQVHDTRIQMRVYAPDLDTAGPLGDQLETAFKDQPLFWQNGAAGKLVRHDRRQAKDPWWATGGAGSWHLLLEFQCRVRRS